ncbi:accessory gene regulator B family protein [Paraclostridium sordellii]
MFKKLSFKITNMLVSNDIIDNNDFEIYRYGFETLIYFIVNISVVLFIGIIFNRFIQTIVFLSCYCTLRQFTGGYHAKNYTECTLTFAIIYLITILISNTIGLYKSKYLIMLFLILSTIIIYKFAPLDHRNKPLSEKEKKHYKNISIKILTFINFLLILSVVFDIFIEYVIYLLFAVIWICILLIIGFYKK